MKLEFHSFILAVTAFNLLAWANCDEQPDTSTASRVIAIPSPATVRDAAANGVPIELLSRSCSSREVEAGFETFKNSTGSETCVCQRGRGIANIEGVPFCFRCRDADQRISSGVCYCVDLYRSYTVVSKALRLTRTGRCASPILRASALARARRHTNTQVPTNPKASRHFHKTPKPEEVIPCGGGEASCKLGAKNDAYECVNLQEELTRCGKCDNDCTKIKHVKNVGCEYGRCKIFSCKSGFKPAVENPKLGNGTHYIGQMKCKAELKH